MEDNKIAIIGAGPAGISLAHLLSESGYTASNIDIYDARDRIGGQSLTLHLYRDAGLDMGTIFSHFGYNRIHRLMKKMGIHRIPYPTNNVFIFFDHNGNQKILKFIPSELIHNLSYPFHLTYYWVKWMLGFLSRKEEAERFSNFLIRKHLKADENNPFYTRPVLSAIGDEGQLYGPSPTLTLRNALSWQTPAIFISEALRKVCRIKEGYQVFWERLLNSQPYNIILNTKITHCIPQDSQTVLLLPIQKKYRHVFVTTPLDQIETPLSSFLDLPFNDSYILSTLIKIPRGIWGYEVETIYTFNHPFFKTITSVSSYPMLSNIERDENENFDTLWFLSRITERDHISDSLIASRLDELSQLVNIPREKMEVVHSVIWRYNIHYSEKQLLNDLPSKIDDMQGKDGIWYSGGTLSHWNVASIHDFNICLMRRFLWKNESSKIKALLKGLRLGYWFPVIQGNRYR